MSNKIDFFGYEGKMTYENQNSGIRTFQMDIDLLHKINSFTLNVMKEEEFKPKDVIRDFRMTSNGDFSFKCGGGYKISDEQFKKIYEKEVEYRDNFINFKVYNKDGEEIFDRNTFKNSDEYNFKEVRDLFLKDDDPLIFFKSKENYDTWEKMAENKEVIVVYENKKTGELISDYSKENYSNLVFERKKDNIVKEEIDRVKAIVEYYTDEKTRVTNAENFNELRDIYAKDVRSLTRLIEDLEKENQKNKIIPKEKEIETEKNNDKEMEF